MSQTDIMGLRGTSGLWILGSLENLAGGAVVTRGHSFGYRFLNSF